MYRDIGQWLEIRRRVLVDGLGRRDACRRYGIHWKTLCKILAHTRPPGYMAKAPRSKPKLGPFVARIADILQEDSRRPPKWRRSARQIYRDIRARGFQGSYTC